MKIDKPGIYELTDEKYHGDCCAGPSLSSSGAVTLANECPMRFWWDSYMNAGRSDDSTKNAEIGKASHIAILKPDQWSDLVAILPFDDFKTKAAREARDMARAAGKIVLKTEAAAEVLAMSQALHRHPVASELVQRGTAERAYVWQDPQTNIWLKAKPDYMRPKALVDLKTAPSANPAAFSYHLYSMGYHQQAAWYLDGVEAVTGERPDRFVFIVQEREPPYLVTVCPLDLQAVEWGAKLNRKAINLFAQCVERNDWPGYQDQPISLPTHAHFKLAEREADGEFHNKLLQRAAEFQAPIGGFE